MCFQDSRHRTLASAAQGRACPTDMMGNTFLRELLQQQTGAAEMRKGVRDPGRGLKTIQIKTERGALDRYT